MPKGKKGLDHGLNLNDWVDMFTHIHLNVKVVPTVP